MAIFLLILKIAGIVLLSVLGLVLLLLLVLLLTPVRYRFHVAYEKEVPQIKASIYIWFHLLHASFTYGMASPDGVVVRVAGIPLGSKNQPAHKEKKKAFAEQKAETEDSFGRADKTATHADSSSPSQEKIQSAREAKRTSSSEDTGKAGEEQTQKKSGEEQEVHKDTADQRIFVNQIQEKIQKISERLREMWEAQRKKMMELQRKWNRLQQIWEPHGKLALEAVLYRLTKLLKHIFPRKLKGEATLGLGNTYQNGKLFSWLGMFYGVYGKHFQINGDFERKIYEGRIQGKGHIRLGTLLGILLPLAWNSHVWAVIRTVRKQEE